MPRVFLVLVVLVGLCTAQGGGRGAGKKDRGGRKKGAVEEVEMKEMKEDGVKKAPKLPKQKYIFKAAPWSNEGPMFRSFNKGCQMVCMGSFSLPLFANREYFKYHQINLTDCFNAPQLTSNPIIYDGAQVTRLDASMGVLLSHPEPVFERAEFEPTGRYGQGDYYFEFGVFSPARAMDSRVYIDWEVRRNVSYEFMGSNYYESCVTKLDNERNQEMMEEQQPRWNLDAFTKIEPIVPTGEEREERMMGEGRDMREERMMGEGRDMKKRTMERMEKLVNKQSRMKDEM